MSSKVDDQFDQSAKETARSKGPKSPIDVMDARLESCFLYAIKFSVKESELPLPASNFYKTHMTKYCPTGEHLEIKRSSYKKLSKFLKKQEKAGIISVKEKSKGGGEHIVKVDKSHYLLQGLDEYADSKDTKPVMEKKVPKVASNRPIIREMFEITSDVLPIFGRLGYREGDILKSRDVRQIIVHHIKDKDLPDDDFDFFLSKLVPVCEIRTTTGLLIKKKGDICPIKIDITDSGPSRQTTVIENLDEFGIELHEFCDTVHKKLSRGASVTSSHSDHTDEKISAKVVVQGNQIGPVGDLLLTDYCVPRKFLTRIIRDEYEVVPKVISKSEAAFDKKIQYRRRNGLCISGIPEKENEDKKELILSLARDLKVKICKKDIDSCDRSGVPWPGRSRDIVVEFASMSARQNLLINRRKLREMEAWKYVYINEELSPLRKMVFYKARQYAHAKLVKSAFTRDGIVYIIDHAEKKHMITDPEELTVFGPLNPPEPKLEQL